MARKLLVRIWIPVALMVLLCACPTAPAGDTATTAVKAIAALTYADFGFPSGSEAAVSTSFTVPLSKDGATFSWSSTSIYVSKIDQSGDKGQVFLTIPDIVAEGTEVTLSVAATAARSTAAKDFTVKLHAISDPTEAATAVAAGLTSGLLDLSGTDSATSLTGSFNLPIAGSYGTEITWASSDPAITVDAAGKAVVLTPTGTTSTPVTLTPTVKKKGVAPKVGTPITVTVHPLTAQEAVTKDAEAITSDTCTFGPSDNAKAVTTNFGLPLKGDRGTVLAWTSSDPAVASPSNTTGTVTITPAASETSVTLTAQVTQPSAATQPQAGTATVTVKVKAKGTIAVVNVGTQTGTIYGGAAGSVTFAVTSTNITSGTTPSFTWYTSSAGTTAGTEAPSGITPSPTSIAGGGADTITVTATSSVVAGSYYFKVSYGTTTSAVVTVTVGSALSATAKTTAQSLSQNMAMTSFSPLSASGGKIPYVYTVSSGTLPPGLSLSSLTGEVTGTPTSVQSAADVVFSVRDANSVTASTTSTVSFAVAGPLDTYIQSVAKEAQIGTSGSKIVVSLTTAGMMFPSLGYPKLLPIYVLFDNVDDFSYKCQAPSSGVCAIQAPSGSHTVTGIKYILNPYANTPIAQ